MGSFVYIIARDDADIILQEMMRTLLKKNDRNLKKGWRRCLMQQV